MPPRSGGNLTAATICTSLAPGPHLKLFTKHHPLFGGVKPEEFDMFHEMIAHEELSRIGCPGVCCCCCCVKVLCV